MRIVITGAASFLGLALCRRFSEAGDRVFALVRPGARNKKALLALADAFPALQIIEMDVGEMAHFREHFDVCLHLAWGGIGSQGRMDSAIQEVNVANTKTVAAVCARQGCKKLLFAGSQAEYGNTLQRVEKTYGRDWRLNRLPKMAEDFPPSPLSEYGRGKLKVWQELSRLGGDMEYMHLRIFSVFGRGDHETSLVAHCIRQMKRGEKALLGECTQAWNYLYEKDLVEAVFLLASLPPQRGLARIINVASRRTDLLRAFAAEIGDFYGVPELLEFQKREAGEEGIPFLNPDISLLEGFGFQEKFSFSQALQDMEKDAWQGELQNSMRTRNL